MLRYGIPAYRLPKEWMDRELNHVWELGATFRPNMRLGRDFHVADLLEHAGTADGLIHAADRALYTAKSLGRDRVVVASAGQEPITAPSPRGSAEAMSPPIG